MSEDLYNMVNKKLAMSYEDAIRLATQPDPIIKPIKQDSANLKKAAAKVKKGYTESDINDPYKAYQAFTGVKMPVPYQQSSTTINLPSGMQTSPTYAQTRMCMQSHQEASINQVPDGTWDLTTQNDNDTIICDPEMLNALVTNHNEMVTRLLELHRQDGEWCEWCDVEYPCPTVEAIQPQ